MAFNFFTFGGSIFWEDVFFYQKWRIQRHCFTKKYRLLDSWDIRRAIGSFEKCQRVFIKYIDSYEIDRQKGKLIVLLHGYGESKNIFKPLWRKLILTNSTVAAINYPSLFRNSLASAHQLLFFLNHMADITEVSFVTKGGGNLVLQKAFQLPLELQAFRLKMRIGNIVEINPITKNNIICDFFRKFRIFRFLLGPMFQDFSRKNLTNTPSLPSEFNSLKIFSPSKFSYIFYSIFGFKYFFSDIMQTNPNNELYLQNPSWFVLHNAELINYTMKFIKNGKI